jgi:hypothetical protein
MSAERMTSATNADGLEVRVGGFYRWKGRRVRVSSMWPTTPREAPHAAVWEPLSDRPDSTRRNVSIDELEGHRRCGKPGTR